jgi:hypothetical protein
MKRINFDENPTMETATIKSWPEWLHWCSVSINSQGQWPEKPSKVATYWLDKLPLRFKELLKSEKGWFVWSASMAWTQYKEFISEREKQKQDDAD